MMDLRSHQVADLLLLIEAELRRQGHWASQAPSVERLASPEPFCVDTLSFIEWLQWIFLPRMHQLLEEGAPLPGASAIAPMAQYSFAQQGVSALGLIALLEQFDALLSDAASVS